jgi:hypothetical protein
MAMTMSGTTLTFNDSTTQTTAAGGAPAHLAIGHVGLLQHTITTVQYQGNTLSGGYLYKITSGTTSPRSLGEVHYFAGHVRNSTAATLTLDSATFSNSSGTWRFVGGMRSTEPQHTVDGYGAAFTSTFLTMWQRIS